MKYILLEYENKYDSLGTPSRGEIWSRSEVCNLETAKKLAKILGLSDDELNSLDNLKVDEVVRFPIDGDYEVEIELTEEE